MVVLKIEEKKKSQSNSLKVDSRLLIHLHCLQMSASNDSIAYFTSSFNLIVWYVM